MQQALSLWRLPPPLMRLLLQTPMCSGGMKSRLLALRWLYSFGSLVTQVIVLMSSPDLPQSMHCISHSVTQIGAMIFDPPVLHVWIEQIVFVIMLSHVWVSSLTSPSLIGMAFADLQGTDSCDCLWGK